MSKELSRYLVTQSLLGSWLYQYEAYDPDAAHESFLSTLRRESIRPSMAMLNGQKFENMVTAYCGGAPLDYTHEWAHGIKSVGDRIKGGQFQVALYKDKTIDGINFLLYGRLDALKAGTISDIKYSNVYDVGKFADSPQHPMYMDLCPEARQFEYLISNGSDVFVETYRRDECPQIDGTIRDFMRYLTDIGQLKTYFDLWKAREY